MLPDLWYPNLTVVFVGTVADELSDILGFYHLQPKDRFWELLENGGITPQRIITKQEGKALVEGHKQGSLSDPVRLIFIEKKTGRLRQLGIGLTDLNRRLVAPNEKDKSARPTPEDVAEFVARVEGLEPHVLAFAVSPDLFLDGFKSRYPAATSILGVQPFTIGISEVWLLGSTVAQLRGEALTKQEDAFFALGERLEEITGKGSQG